MAKTLRKSNLGARAPRSKPTNPARRPTGQTQRSGKTSQPARARRTSSVKKVRRVKNA